MKAISLPAFGILAASLVVCGCGGGSQAPSPPPIYTVSLSSVRAALTTGQIYPVTATTNDPSGVIWSSTGGSFPSPASLTGAPVNFTAPNTAGSFTVTAKSASDATKSASMAVYVTDLPGVTTYHNDLARDGANVQEYALTPATVNTSTFGRLFSCPVDGAIYAQPLWARNLAVNGAPHNTVLVATEHDSLYAFDADAVPCAQLWHVSLIDSNHGANSGETPIPSGIPGGLLGSGFGDIAPEVGVTGTPVIDPATGTIYVVSKSMNSAGTLFFQRLHAIDLTSGAEKFAGPANIGPAITYPGTGDGGATVSFNPRMQNQRPGLALVNGVVYIAWASHEDTLPYYGWLVGFNASNLAITSVLNVSPNVQFGGIWMGGGAPSADAANHLYLITGNAVFDADSPTVPNDDYGDSFLQVTGGVTISSYFTPSDQESDDVNDADFGSGGSAVVVNLNSGSVKHLVIGGGKDGELYLLDGDNMGGVGDPNARQSFNVGASIFATGAFWNSNYYIAPISSPLAAYSYNSSTNLMNPAPTSSSTALFNFPGATPSVSANGTSNGVIWALDNSLYCTPQSRGCGPALLHAYDASSLATELWNSNMVAGDAAGNAVKFTVPTVANGRVYVGTRGNNAGDLDSSTTIPGELDVFGLKSN